MRAPPPTTRRAALAMTAALGCERLPVVALDGGAARDVAPVSDAPDAPDAPPPHITQVATGGTHVCAIDRDQALWCWGSNRWGEVTPGDPEVVVTRPRRVPGVRAAQVSVGLGLTCVLRTDATAQCWGRNDVGQVDSLHLSPVEGPRVVIARDVQRLVVGGEVGVALRRDQSLWGWGSHVLGWDPRELGVTQVREARSGLRHACAARADGGVRCVGSNMLRALGDPAPVSAVGTPPVPPARAVAVGAEFSCALTLDGAVWCWGANESAQLGRGTRSVDEGPAAVPGLSGVDAMLAGGSTLFVRRGGAWFGLGDNRFGQFMHAETPRGLAPTPALARLRADVAEVVVGDGHACARHDDGGVACWGSNVYGALGRGGLGGFSVVPEAPRW